MSKTKYKIDHEGFPYVGYRQMIRTKGQLHRLEYVGGRHYDVDGERKTVLIWLDFDTREFFGSKLKTNTIYPVDQDRVDWVMMRVATPYPMGQRAIEAEAERNWND